MSVSTVPFGTNVLSTSPTIGNFQQFSRPVSGDEYLEGQNFFAHVGNMAPIIASVEADLLLKGLDFHKVITKAPKPISRSWCSRGLIGGLATSLLTKNPFPFLIGISGCFPRVEAQQRVGSEFRVNTNITGGQLYSSITTLVNENFVVTWLALGGVYGQLFNKNGSKIGNESLFALGSRPSAASLLNGNFVVTFENDGLDGDKYGVFGQLFTENGSKIGSAFQVNTIIIDNQWYSSLASTTNGNFVVSWMSSSISQSEIYGQLFYGNRTRFRDEFLVNTMLINRQERPSIESLANGNFVVTWESYGQDGSMDGVYGQLFAENNAKIGNEFQVNTETLYSQKTPFITSLQSGNLIVTWDGNQDIYVQLFDINCTKIGSELQVNTYTTNTQGSPTAASLTNGNFVVIWTSFLQDGSETGVYGQLFNETGTKIGSEFQVNSYTNSWQNYPSVAGLPDASFVVTWDSFDQDGFGYEIYGQLFDGSIILLPTTSSSTSIIDPTTRSSTSSIDPTSFTRISTSKTNISSLGVSQRVSEINSPSTYPNKRLIWLWVLLGIVGGTSCIGFTGYVLLKSRRKKKEGDGSSLELGDTKPSSQSEVIEGAPSNSREGYANAPRDAAGNIGYANIPEGTALRKDYANRPKDADLRVGYAHLPDDREK